MAESFEPRFVDLVRNYTITQGTGNFALGAVVAGYRGFASAVQPGERFYYSALGVDKPEEFEVGRGTMQADGTISREPIGGAATNFTAGTKTIALVAAAEWFEDIQTESAATPTSVATRAELAALSDTSRPAVLTEHGREGLFVFDAADRSADVAADPGQGIHVAPASDPSGLSGAWVRRYSGGIDPKWFGAAGDGVTDDSAAIQAALTYFERTSGGTLSLVGGAYRTTGTLLLFAPDVTIDARGATLVSSDEFAEPGLYVGGDRTRILGGTWQLTGGHHGPRWFDVEGKNCEIDGARIVKDPETTGVQGYVRASADGFIMRNCRIEGSDGIQHEASHSAYLFNEFSALQFGGDDGIAIKAIQGSAENIRIIGNRFRLFSNFVAIGSNIGTLGVDDPDYSMRVRNVVVVGNTGEECANIALIKPGAVNGKDYRNGLVEGVTISDNVLFDPQGTKFKTGITIKAANGAWIRNVKGSNNLVHARARSPDESDGHLRVLDILAVIFNTGAPSIIEDVDVGLTFVDPYDGAPNSAAKPGHPVVNIVNVQNDNGSTIRNIRIRVEGNGSSGPGIDIGPDLNDSVHIDRAVLRNVNLTGGASGGGIRTRSRVHLTSDQISIGVGSGSPWNLVNGTSAEIIGPVDAAFFAEAVGAGADEQKRPWAAPRNAFVHKVELLNSNGITRSADDTNYTQFEFRNHGGTGNIFSSASSKLSGGQSFAANVWNTLLQARDVTNPTQLADCFFARGSVLALNKNDFGAGNQLTDAYVRIHWAPF